MGTAGCRRLDPSTVFVLNDSDIDLAKIIAEETEAERCARQVAASTVPEQSDYTADEIAAMSWDELLVLDGECFIRCCSRAELPPDRILEFVEVQCDPGNPIAVSWFRLFVRALASKETDATGVIARLRSEAAKAAAEAKHDRPGGTRWKRQRIREIWATGKYSSRDICAEQEAAALGMSFSTARKALRGTPDPG